MHAQATGTASGVHVVRDIWFRPGDHAVTFQVTLQNTSASAVNNVAWLEDYDPDQGYALAGDYNTSNDVLFGGHYVEAVYRYSPTYPNGLTIGIGSDDPRAVASASAYTVIDPFGVINSPVDPNGASADILSDLAFNVGTLAPGASTTLTYYMVFASDRQVAADLYQAQLRTAVPVTPTTATFVNGVWTGVVAVSQPATQMYLQVDDGAGHLGNSNSFDVGALPFAMPTFPADANEADGIVNGTLNILAALESDLVVSIASSDTSRATVPATVTIPAGQTSAPLPLTIINNALLEGPQAVVITTTATEIAPASATLTIHDDETAVLTVALPANAMEGAGVLHGAGTITASVAPSRDVVIHLTSNNTTEVAVPTTVILPAGQTSVTFDLTIGDDWIVNGTQSVAVAAHFDNWTDGSASINVYNVDVMGLNGDWLTLGNGPSHTGYFPGILGDTPLTSLRWSVSIASAQVAVGDGRVYITPDTSGLVALDENTGATVEIYLCGGEFHHPSHL